MPRARIRLPNETRCGKCGGRVHVEHYYEGDESVCLNCGNVGYGEGYAPMDRPPGADRKPTRRGLKL